jgi:hypothetical protein
VVEGGVGAKLDVTGEGLPDLIAPTIAGSLAVMNEVENRGVVTRLRDDGLDGLGYATVVHFETECVYGLDNAVLSRFPLMREPALHSVNLPGTEASRRARGRRRFVRRAERPSAHTGPRPSGWPEGRGPVVETQRAAAPWTLRG